MYGIAVGPERICVTRAYSRTNIPWASKLHLLAHIIMAEAPMAKENEAPPTFYLRRAQIYEAMSEHLSDHEVSFRDKIISFITLSLIETSLSMLELQARHVNALHDFIEDNGGMRRALSELCPADLADDLPGVLIQNLSENVPIAEIYTLEESITCMTTALRNTVSWASNTIFSEHSKTMVTLQSQMGRKHLPRLRKYLAFLTNCLKREDLDPRVSQGIFHCVFGNILLHQVIYDFDALTSLRFLEGLEECMAAHNAARPCEVLFSNIFWVRGAAPSSMLNSVHSKINESVKEKEIQILEGTYALLRLATLLSTPVRAKLAQSIYNCIFASIKPTRTNVMTGKFLYTIAADIRQNWGAQRAALHSVKNRGAT